MEWEIALVMVSYTSKTNFWAGPSYYLSAPEYVLGGETFP